MGITISLKHKMMKHSEDNGFCNLDITELSNTIGGGTYVLVPYEDENGVIRFRIEEIN